ncbi:hypothetical protein [Nostoc sp. LEGE 12447]|uniref:hypothetical protein n=1 Tax=Nostoc sp. LEGE 12447 TaxID=1828640 RepID=UPI0018840659|nr:hypothetical protein [Nostoc sp. LEGE 12447]
MQLQSSAASRTQTNPLQQILPTWTPVFSPPYKQPQIRTSVTLPLAKFVTPPSNKRSATLGACAIAPGTFSQHRLSVR